MRLALIGLGLLVACSRSPGSAREPISDPMLDPARLAVLEPAQIVARLGLRPDAVVVDVGAGPGAFTHALAAAVPGGRVIATDVRDDYLRRVNADSRAAGERNIETRRVSPDEPGLEPGAVDLAFLCQVDHYLRDRVSYFGLLTRALRPGGRIAVVNYAREEKALEQAAATNGWRVLDRWEPAPGFFARIYAAGALP